MPATPADVLSSSTRVSGQGVGASPEFRGSIGAPDGPSHRYGQWVDALGESGPSRALEEPPAGALALLTMPVVVFVLGGCYLASAGLVLVRGRTPTVPVAFAVLMVAVCLPMAVAMLSAGTLQRLAGGRVQLPFVFAACGLGMAMLYDFAPFWAFAAVAGTILQRRELCSRSAGPRLVFVMTSLALGYGAVWNANIAAAAVTREYADELLLRSDMWLYGLIGLAETHVGLFPLLRDSVANRLLEAGYLLVFPAVLTVSLFLVMHAPQRLPAFVAGLFGGYVVGLLVFLAVPAVGPCIAFPDTIAPAFRTTVAGQAMTAMEQSFDAVQSGHGPPAVAYFVALPSLHAVVGIYLQAVVRTWRWLFWLLLPINILVVASTVLLGFHYVLDAVAAVPVALVVAKATNMAWRRIETPTATAGPESTVTSRG